MWEVEGLKTGSDVEEIDSWGGELKLWVRFKASLDFYTTSMHCQHKLACICEIQLKNTTMQPLDRTRKFVWQHAELEYYRQYTN